MMNERDLQRFMSYVSPEPNSGCWLWEGALYTGGYAAFTVSHKAITGAHRHSYLHFKGEIGPWLQIDHLCGVKCCVNPDHLEAVTAEENTQRYHRKKAA